jgi:hypothetical protein
VHMIPTSASVERKIDNLRNPKGKKETDPREDRFDPVDAVRNKAKSAVRVRVQNTLHFALSHFGSSARRP